MKRNTVLISTLGLALAASLATASPDDHERSEYYSERGPVPFEVMDLNRDGVVTAEEHAQLRAQRRAARAQQGYPMRNAASAPNYEQIDTDGNGTVSPEEFAAHRARRAQQWPGMGGSSSR